MSWRLLDKPKTQKATIKLAKQFAEMEPAPHDRPLSERRLGVYRKTIMDGGFRPPTWASALCTETGGLYRVNGKHTSIVVAAMNPAPDFYVVVEVYECDTLEDVAKLYATFDSALQSRSARDIYLSFAATVPELKAVPASVIATAVAGMAMHRANGVSKLGSQPAERAELLLDHPEFVLWVRDILAAPAEESVRGADGRRQAKHIFRQPCVAAMLGTWERAKGQAGEFWCAVRDETGTTPKLPDRVLARYLHQVGLDSGGGAKRLRAVTSREMYVKCIHGWNAWRKNETTALNYHADKDVPAFK